MTNKNKIEILVTQFPKKKAFLVYREKQIFFVSGVKETLLTNTAAGCYDLANALDEMGDKIRQLKKEPV